MPVSDRAPYPAANSSTGHLHPQTDH